VEASVPQFSADLPGRPFAATNANASGPNFDALSIYRQDEHGRRNHNAKPKSAHAISSLAVVFGPTEVKSNGSGVLGSRYVSSRTRARLKTKNPQFSRR